MIIAFVIMVIVFSLAKPDTFPTWENWKNILTAAAPALIVAAGLTVPLVMQDFDLSFGAMISLAGGCAVALMAKNDVGLGARRSSPGSGSVSQRASRTAS